MFNKIKNKLTNIATNGFPITISADTIQNFIRTKSSMPDVVVEITHEHIVLSGTTEVKKMLLKKNVSFMVKLKPVQLEKRTILFELVEIKPIDMGFINNKIFSKPPFLEYTDRTIIIDLNAWEIVRKVPVGNIKSYELVDGALTINVSL